MTKRKDLKANQQRRNNSNLRFKHVGTRIVSTPQTLTTVGLSGGYQHMLAGLKTSSF